MYVIHIIDHVFSYNFLLNSSQKLTVNR